MQQVFEIYNRFLSYLPSQYYGYVSVIIAALLIIGVYKIIKKEFIWLLILVVLLPATIPILETAWNWLVETLRFLLSK